MNIRPLKIWEIPRLLKFKERNDYRVLSEAQHKSDGLFYAVLKVLWYGNRMLTMIAEKDGNKIVGYITMVFGGHLKFKGNAYLVSGSVEESERGKGIFTALFKSVEEHALANAARRIELEAFASNAHALRLYQRLGYQVEGVKRHAVQIRGEYDDLVFMAKLFY